MTQQASHRLVTARASDDMGRLGRCDVVAEALFGDHERIALAELVNEPHLAVRGARARRCYG